MNLAARTAAEEARFFRAEDELALQKRMERLVSSSTSGGNALSLPCSSSSSSSSSSRSASLNEFQRECLAAAKRGMTKTSVRSTNPLKVDIDTSKMGRRNYNNFMDYLKVPQVNMGRSKWEVNDDASIFSVKDGKRLAVTNVEESTHLRTTSGARTARVALARQMHVESAQVDATTYKGMRMYPKLNAGRAFMWGSVLALWGTSLLVLGSSKFLKIQTVEDLDTFVQKNASKPVENIKNTLQTNFKPKNPEDYHRMKDAQFIDTLKTKFR